MTMRTGTLSLLALLAMGAAPRPKPTLVVETTYVFGSPTSSDGLVASAEPEQVVIAFPPIVVEASPVWGVEATSSNTLNVQAALRLTDRPAWQTN